MMIGVIIIVLLLWWWISSPDEPNTFVVDIESGRVVKMVFVEWHGQANTRMDGIVAARLDYPKETFELVEIDDALSRYDVHVYNRE